MTDQAPLQRTQEAVVPAAATAIDASTTVLEAPFAGTVTGVEYVPNAAITGANTDTRKVALVNKGQSGAGSTEIASIQFNAGVNGVGFDAKALTLSGTPANLVIAPGDVLAWVSTHVGTGLADPGGTVFVTVSRS